MIVIGIDESLHDALAIHDAHGATSCLADVFITGRQLARLC